MANSGTLYVVSTPIGNLGDLSGRARDTLESVQLILAEDTRHFRKLADHFGITTPVKSYHEHNERSVSEEVVEQLKSGLSVALVSDAGTPTISDPGYHIINACHNNKISVRSIPGPCAAISAISLSGFNTTSFTYRGFLPVKSGRKEAALREALNCDHPTIFYESPHRIVKTLELALTIAPEATIFVVREITKLHEEYFRGPVKDVLAALLAKPSIKGEFVFITSGA